MEEAQDALLMRRFAMLAKQLRVVSTGLLDPYGVRVGQNLMLEQLWQTDGLTPGEAAARLGITGPTAVRMAQRMEESGLVVRRRDARDGRLIRIYLTDRGRELQEPIERDFRERDARVLAGFAPHEHAQLRCYLERMIANLDAD